MTYNVFSRTLNPTQSINQSHLHSTAMRLCNNQDDIYGAVIMTMATVRVYPVHLMNAD